MNTQIACCSILVFFDRLQPHDHSDIPQSCFVESEKLLKIRKFFFQSRNEFLLNLKITFVLLASKGLACLFINTFRSFNIVETFKCKESENWCRSNFIDRCVGAESLECIQHWCINWRTSESSTEMRRWLNANWINHQRWIHWCDVHKRKLL